MVNCLLRTVVWTRIISRAGEVVKAEVAAGPDLLDVYCAVPTVVMTVGYQAIRMARMVVAAYVKVVICFVGAMVMSTMGVMSGRLSVWWAAA